MEDMENQNFYTVRFLVSIKQISGNSFHTDLNQTYDSGEKTLHAPVTRVR